MSPDATLDNPAVSRLYQWALNNCRGVAPIEATEPEPEPGICGSCAGSGEGRCDGDRCGEPITKHTYRSEPDPRDD